MYMNAYESAGREWMILYLVNGLKVEEVRTGGITVWEAGTGGKWRDTWFREYFVGDRVVGTGVKRNKCKFNLRKIKLSHHHVRMGCYVKGENVALGSHRLSCWPTSMALDFYDLNG